MKKILLVLMLLSAYSAKAEPYFVPILQSAVHYPGGFGNPPIPAGGGIAQYPICAATFLCSERMYVNYIGFTARFSDSVYWIDGLRTTYYEDTADGDFSVTLFADDVEIFSSIVREPTDDFFGVSFFNTEPLDLRVKNVSLLFQPVDDLGNPASTDFKIAPVSYALYVSDDTMLGYVPEPETFALFLLGAVGLCVRRQIKANATLPV